MRAELEELLDADEHLEASLQGKQIAKSNRRKAERATMERKRRRVRARRYRGGR